MENNRGLARVLSLFDVSILASASMGPAYSLASTLGPMVVAAGTATPLALIALTFCMGCIAWSYSQLSYRYPNSGSSYAWIEQAFGPFVGSLGAWLLLMANIFAVLATAIPAGTYTLDVVAPKLVDSPLAVAVVAAIWVLISGALLSLGLRPTAGVTAILLIGEVAVLAASAVAAALHPAVAAVAVPTIGTRGVAWTGFTTAMVLAIWMVDGWELSAATSEESHHDRGPGLGGLYAVGGVSLTLLISMLAYLHFIPQAAFNAHQADAMNLVGVRLGGAWVPIIVITVLFSTSASLWTTIIYLTRSLYAMGRNGVLPSWFARLSESGNPKLSLAVVTGVTSVLTVLSGASPTVGGALGLALSGSGVFLGLIFVGTACAAVKLVRQGQSWALGVALPLFGAVTIGTLSFGQLIVGDEKLRLFAVAALIVGIPFALWRARFVRIAAR